MVRRAEMQSNRNAGGRKKDAIHFVNARPASETERRKIQKLVRAHVGKWISDQTKDRAAAPEIIEHSPLANTVKTESPSLALELETDDPFYHSSPSPSSSLPSVASSRGSPDSYNSLVVRPPSRSLPLRSNEASSALVSWQPHSERCTHQNDSVDCCQCSWASGSDTSSPPQSADYIELMGASVIDPFRTYPSQIEPDLIQASETYCLSTLWPGLTPCPDGSDASSNSWFPISLSDPTLFTAFLYGSLSHRRVQWLTGWIPFNSFQEREQRLLQMCEMDTIKMVSREMNNPSRAVCDALILSVVCMAHNKADGSVFHNQGIPFNAPMQRLQWLDIYGSLPPNLVHIRGLVQMVTLRGGIHAITLPGLSAVISFSDLVTASTFLTVPVFPFVALVEDRKDKTLQEVIGFTESDIDNKFNHLQPLGLPRDILQGLCAMDAYTHCLEGHVQGHRQLDFSLLTDRRNATQHMLLKIPSASQLDGFTSYGPREIIYEACRLAMLIYGVGVILPLPAQSTPLRRLAEYVQGTLQISNGPNVWESQAAQAILLWIITLGGISAERQKERPWYAQMLHQALLHNEISTWENLNKILVLMPWSPTACDRPAYNLWLEAQQLKELESDNHSKIWA